MTETESRGTFLYEASRSLLSTSPALSRYYASQFHQITENDDDLDVHPAVQQHICPQCGQMYTPGVNCKLSRLQWYAPHARIHGRYPASIHKHPYFHSSSYCCNATGKIC
ncbi:hypothetical protein BCR43DRAFT_482612 [Syncephalastrum racemosum]|uniref:C2H2-type domain-containing protein n=1 Tax=Syncephalastrum racemosum TaxID=13706 RepID=A0A1X2HTW4_SYNRA|nr:hypothetical protein BCR43DRAFT_482612 [Syncephalastrum racemosum]